LIRYKGYKGATMTQDETDRLFGDDIPASVRAEAAVEEAKRVLYTFGVLPEEYHSYYSLRYAMDAAQEGREREALGHEQGDLL
jgi:hypothetical protein